jgi:acyl carrier protein
MEESIYSVFSRVFGVSRSSLSAASSPDTIPRWDSFGHIELIEALERTFSLRFVPDEISEMQSLGAIQQVLRRRLFP